MKTEVKHIVILVLPNPTILSIAGPLEVFARTAEVFSKSFADVDFGYQVHVVSSDQNQNIKTSSGLPIMAEGSYLGVDYLIDTLIVSGIASLSDLNVPTDVLEWIRDQFKSVRRIASVCTGAFVLAEAGILNGRNVTTHWDYCKMLSKLYPDVVVEVSSYFVKDGNIYTSAGISSGLDLSLALIEEDLGKNFALQIAKWMVLCMRRDGNQLQYGGLAEYHQLTNKKIRKVCEWLHNHIQDNPKVEDLADIAVMSPRNFARVFVRELKITPAKYIDQLKVENACQYLSDVQLSIDEVSELCGLRNAESLRRLFIKVLDTTPAQYRRCFY